MFATSKSTKQLMDESKCFKVLFWSSIVFFSLGIIAAFSLIFEFCHSRIECSGEYPNSCQVGALFQCCQISCTNCMAMVNEVYYHCTAQVISTPTFLSLGAFLSIIVFIMYCKFRAEARRGGYVQLVVPSVATSFSSNLTLQNSIKPNTYKKSQQFTQPANTYNYSPQNNPPEFPQKNAQATIELSGQMQKNRSCQQSDLSSIDEDRIQCDKKMSYYSGIQE